MGNSQTYDKIDNKKIDDEIELTEEEKKFYDYKKMGYIKWHTNEKNETRLVIGVNLGAIFFVSKTYEKASFKQIVDDIENKLKPKLKKLIEIE